jgi:hypothetical protein
MLFTLAHHLGVRLVQLPERFHGSDHPQLREESHGEADHDHDPDGRYLDPMTERHGDAHRGDHLSCHPLSQEKSSIPMEAVYATKMGKVKFPRRMGTRTFQNG